MAVFSAVSETHGCVLCSVLSTKLPWTVDLVDICLLQEMCPPLLVSGRVGLVGLVRFIAVGLALKQDLVIPLQGDPAQLMFIWDCCCVFIKNVFSSLCRSQSLLSLIPHESAKWMGECSRMLSDVLVIVASSSLTQLCVLPCEPV